ncbi:ABC transporter ATP-binding protein [Mycoplasma marinum]
MLKNPLHSELIGIKNEIKKMKKMRGSSAMVKKLNIGKQEILEKIAELKIKNQKEIKEIKERIEEIKIIEGSINLPLTLEMKELKNQIKNDKNIAKNKQRISEIQKELAILKQKHKEAIKVSSDKLVESMVIWKASIPERVRRITELIGIDNYLNSKPMELSGGQRQRVALARSISRDANIFLYDEPLSNLDAKLRVTMRVEVRKLHDMLGAISIYVTHDQVEAMSMADKIVVINKGYIQQVGSPKEMFDQPANLFVAKFIGTPSINQLNGKLDLEGVLSIGKHIFDYASPQELKKNIEKYHGKDIYLCFRPQDVQLVGSTSKAKNVIKGEVIIKEMLGYEHSLVVKTKDLGEVNIVVNKNNDISVGETISFKINKENIHLFDKETEISLTSVLNDATKKAHKIMFNSNIEVIKNKITMQKSKNKRTFSQKQLDKCVAIVSKVKREKLENDKKEMQTLIKELKAEIEEK